MKGIENNAQKQTHLDLLKDFWDKITQHDKEEDDDLLNRYLTEFNISLDSQFIRQKPSISRLNIDMLECYKQVITYYLDNMCVVDEGKHSNEGIRLSFVLNELYPEISSINKKNIQTNITRKRDQNYKPRIFSPVFVGIIERVDINSRRKMPGIYQITNRENAETYIEFLEEIIRVNDVLSNKRY
ncbi:hypothetical protein GQ473_05470 [archaeon]|nr:hypothetical protein [archaeon]